MVQNYSGITFFGASRHTEWVDELGNLFGIASQAVAPFSKNRDWYAYGASTSTAWEGHFVFTGRTQTLTYTIEDNNTEGLTELVVNGTVVESWNGVSGSHNGTEDLTSLGLTIGQAYNVTVRGRKLASNDASVKIHWLGFEHTPSYTSPPTFVATDELTYAKMEDIVDGINEIKECESMPPYTFPYHEHSAGLNSATPVDVYIGNMYHTHDKLRYRVFNDSSTSTKGEAVFYINGVEVGTERGQDYADGTIDISGQSLTRGTKYEVKVAMRRYDSSTTENVTIGVYELVQVNDSIGIPAPPSWSAGDLVDDHTEQNWFATMIDRMHPNVTTEPSNYVPLFYAQPVVKVSPEGKWQWTRCAPTLHYKYDGDVSGTPEIFDDKGGVGTSIASLSTGNELQTYAIDTQIPAHYVGKIASGDDMDYCQESKL